MCEELAAVGTALGECWFSETGEDQVDLRRLTVDEEKRLYGGVGAGNGAPPAFWGTAEELYDFEDVLGTGMDMVLLARERASGEKVAVKRVALERDVEVKILRMISHPNIVETRSLFHAPDHMDIVMEYAAGGDLFEYLSREKALDELRARAITGQVLCALEHLHRRGVVHFDVKPENVLISSTAPLEVNLIDFGISEILSSGGKPLEEGGCRGMMCSASLLARKQKEGVLGTKGYIAPELQGDLKAGTVGAPVDVYSTGVVLHLMLCGGFPRFRVGPERRRGKGAETLELDTDTVAWRSLSMPCKDLLQRMLCQDPLQRISISEAAQHPWFSLSDRVIEFSAGISDISAGVSDTLGSCRSFASNLSTVFSSEPGEDIDLNELEGLGLDDDLELARDLEELKGLSEATADATGGSSSSANHNVTLDPYCW